MQRDVDKELDSSIATRRPPPHFVPVDSSAWLDPFEKQLPFRLPPSYRSLLARYRFPSFECSGVLLFGNVNGRQHDDLVVASLRDVTLCSVIRQNGFLQIGRPTTGSYDPICFDLRVRSKTGEADIVRLDHEAILMESRIGVLSKIASSFLELLRD